MQTKPKKKHDTSADTRRELNTTEHILCFHLNSAVDELTRIHSQPRQVHVCVCKVAPRPPPRWSSRTELGVGYKKPANPRQQPVDLVMASQPPSLRTFQPDYSPANADRRRRRKWKHLRVLLFILRPCWRLHTPACHTAKYPSTYGL